jgi:phosphomannomutase
MIQLKSEIFKAYDIRGLYGEDIDADVAEAIGRAFTRVIAKLEGKATGELRLGLGHDMRLSAPELSARYREGMVQEGATVLDAGQVATEVLYYLVGSRDLDGGLMCTASHNPKAYTGAKLIKRGAIALSGDAGIGDVKATIEQGLGDAPGGGHVEEVDVYAEFHEAALQFIDESVVKQLRVVVDGGNGMAGPMVGPLLRHLGLDLVEAYWQPDGNFPGHEPNPLLEENRRFIMSEVVERKADLGIAWDGDADRCFFIDDQGNFVDGDFLTALLSESMLEKHPGRGGAARRQSADEPGRSRLLQDPDAEGGRRLRGRGLRSLLLPGLLLRRLGDGAGAADPGAALKARVHDVRPARALPIEVLHLRRDQLGGRRSGGQDGGAC